METLEFIIYPDGRVKETVTGIVGASCQEVTASIEAQLGVVLEQKVTADHYATKAVESATLTAQSTYSNW